MCLASQEILVSVKLAELDGIAKTGWTSRLPGFDRPEFRSLIKGGIQLDSFEFAYIMLKQRSVHSVSG